MSAGSRGTGTTSRNSDRSWVATGGGTGIPLSILVGVNAMLSLYTHLTLPTIRLV
jgi:hypothetical protein